MDAADLAALVEAGHLMCVLFYCRSVHHSQLDGFL
jgi:hypothetical protein